MNYKKIKCVLKVSQVPLHLYQIIAGFMILKKEGIIDLYIEDSKKYLPYNMMEVEIDEKLNILYDVNDGYDNLVMAGESYVNFMNNILEKYDLCFKRSYSKDYNKPLKNGYKLIPLGLNYMTTIRGNLAHNIYKGDPKKEKIKKVIRRMPFSKYHNNKYLIESFECKPKISLEPKIIFLARLWDPKGSELKYLSKQKIEERLEINNIRVNCIKACRKEFKERFIGGISSSDFSNLNYSEYVIKDNNITDRDQYLKLMKKSDICIATTGLHDSIGWKFGEYVAASKAIVSEKLKYQLPGEFKKEKNYLEFNNVDECVNNIYRLIDDKEKRYEIMKNNYDYYLHYVRADKLVLNTLEKCLEFIENKSNERISI